MFGNDLIDMVWYFLWDFLGFDVFVYYEVFCWGWSFGVRESRVVCVLIVYDVIFVFSVF